MLAVSNNDMRQRIWKFAHLLRERLGENSEVSFEVGKGRSVIGGGSAPAVQPPTTLMAIKHKRLSASEIENRLRHSDPPIICRVFQNRVALDLRTVARDEENELLEALVSLSGQ